MVEINNVLQNMWAPKSNNSSWINEQVNLNAAYCLAYFFINDVYMYYMTNWDYLMSYLNYCNFILFNNIFTY